MAIPAIMKGDDSGGITVTLADGHNYEGATLVVVFNGVTRLFTNLTAGGTVTLAYTAAETAGMPLGTGRVLMRLVGANGCVETVGNADARIKVTDCLAEVNAGGSFHVSPALNPLADVTGLGTCYTPDQVHAKLNEVIAKLGGKVVAIAIAILPCLGALNVQTAPLGGIYNDAQVVTNVTLDTSSFPQPDFTTSNTQLVSTIEATAPVPGDYATVSNRAMRALQDHQTLGPATNYTDRALSSFAATGTVIRSASYGTPTRWTDATGCVWEVVTDAWIDHETGNIFRNGTSIFPSEVTDGEMGGYLTYDPNAMGYLGLEGEGWYYNGENTSGTPSAVIPGGPDATSLDNGRFTFGFTNLVGRVAFTNDLPSTNGFLRVDDVPDWAKESSPPSYTAADVGAAPASIVPVLASVSNDAVTAKLNADTALRIVLGESVWFAVTNYMRTAQGVIPSLQLWEVRGGATNLVYDSREEITNTVRALTRELRDDMTNRIHGVSNAIPSKAWGNYQSDGADNPQPGEVAIINQPTVILTGGGTFNKYLTVGDSSVWILKSSGPVAFGGNTNGNFFAVLDDEGNAHFKVEKTDSYDVPAIVNGILPRQDENSILIYTATTNRLGEPVPQPVLSAADDLKESAWHEEAEGEIDALGLTVSWARDDTIPAWVATITPDVWHPKLFLRAKVAQEGGVAVINTAPARFDGGVKIGNTIYTLVPYTTGGKTYMTLETTP